jgi:RNA polymerase sigma-70 factor (ECF subfamily)
VTRTDSVLRSRRASEETPAEPPRETAARPRGGRIVRTPGVAAAESAEDHFRRLAASELPRSYRLAGLLLGDAFDAEDAVQDALLRAWRELPRLRDPDRFQAWFDRILVNICRDRLRRRRLVRLVAIDPETADEPLHATDLAARTGAFNRTVDPFRAVLERDAVLRATQRLGPEERAVIVLHYWADLTLDDVARRTSSPIGTVKTRLHRALRTLGTLLDEEEGGWA